MSNASKSNDWTKPAAMAIPKEGYFKLEQGRYGPIFPKTPACYGFTIIAKIKPGTEGRHPRVRQDDRGDHRREPDASRCSSCTTCAGCSSTSAPDTYFMYQGIFDTDFDKYTEDAVALFKATGINTVFENLEGFPEDWKTNAPAFIKFVREHQCPSFLEYGEYPVRDSRRDQEGARAEGGVLRCSTRCSDAIAQRAMACDARTRRHPALPAGPAAGAGGALRVPHLPDAGHGRAWLAGIIDKVGTRPRGEHGGPVDARWVTVAFTWNGLRALGVDEASLATFPEEFRQGMAARAEILGDTGANHPDHWVGGLASPDLHAIVILFARDVAERERCVREHQQYAAQFPGVEALSTLDLEATPPFDYAHDHFGYRDRLSQPAIEGIGRRADARVRARRSRPASSSLATPTRTASARSLPQPEILSRNGSFLAYRRLEEHVGAFRDFLRQHGETPEEQELIAAKLMGRWRSGAPLVLAPDKDDPALGGGPAAQQQLQLQGRWTRTAMPCRSARTSGG